MNRRVILLVGTRPEAIKLAPVFLNMAEMGDPEPFLVASGQHRHLVDQALADFDLRPQLVLEAPRTDGGLSTLSAALFRTIDDLLAKLRPAALLAHGDTTTAMVAAQCAFYRRVRVGHVEAGLRSGDLRNPFPEEMNRRAISLAATWHFAPTETARNNLLAEGLRAEDILVTGNTVVDALRFILDRPAIEGEAGGPALPAGVAEAARLRRRLVLVTSHRRENIGRGLENICLALRRLAGLHPEAAFVFPLHPNPEVRSVAVGLLTGRPGIVLTDPQPYGQFINLMKKSCLILTDSGGLQEEGAALGRPVLVMRETTERPEGLTCGCVQMVGTSVKSIVEAVSGMLARKREPNPEPPADNPFGDGLASKRIVEHLRRHL